MLDKKANQLRVTDLKQYDYCQRVLFYEKCLPSFRPRTYKMDAGRDAHEEEPRLAARRTLSKLGLAQGERHFSIRMSSSTLGITGIVDEIIVSEYPSAAYPVDYKLARQASHHYQLQLAAYALLIEENWHLPVPWGYIYLIGVRQVERIELTSELRELVQNTIIDIHRMIDRELMPPPTKQKNKCQDCEFRRICNDIR